MAVMRGRMAQLQLLIYAVSADRFLSFALIVDVCRLDVYSLYRE